MVERIKKKLVNSAILFAIASLVISIIYKMFNNKTKTMKLVNEVWEDIQYELVRELNLPRFPEIQYCTLPNSTASTQCSYTYEGLVEREVIATKSDFIIKIDADKMAKKIVHYKMLTMKPFSGIEKAVIKHTLAHETRHIWQANGRFHIGTRLSLFDTGLLTGYGLKREETDANQFAIDFASNQKEKVVAMYAKAVMDNAGALSNTLFIISREQRELAKRVREVYSK